MQKKIGLFIPCYNVEGTVEKVLSAIPEEVLTRLSKLIIVDNGSSDNTLAEVKQALIKVDKRSKILEKVDFYQNQSNYSLGGSTVVAIKKALESELDFLICLHSDGQADARDLITFIGHIDSDNYDFILGSRLMPESEVQEYSKARLIVNQLFASYQSLLLGAKVYDLGAYLAFNLHTINEVPYTKIPLDMGYHPHLILTCKKLLKRKLHFKEFPITWGKVESSNVNVYVYALNHISRMLQLSFFKPRLEKDYSEDFVSNKIAVN